MNRKILAGLMTGVAIVMSAPISSAYEFSPIVAQFSPSGAGASRSFVVRNTQSETVAIQIEVVKRGADEDGVETQTPDYDSFIVTPPQLVLAPGASQNVRAQWLGDSAPDRELSYRFIVSQVPIAFAKQEAGEDVTATLSVGYRYETAIYITPPDAKPEVRLVSAIPATDTEGHQVLRLSVESIGTTRAILKTPELTVTPTAGGASVTLSGDAVKAMNSKNIICGAAMTFDLPWPEGVPFGDVNVSLQTSYQSF